MVFVRNSAQLRKDVVSNSAFTVALITFAASFIGALPVVVLLIC